MQRDVLKPLFTRQKREDSLLPSVVVLPKIGNDNGDSEVSKGKKKIDKEGQQASSQKPFLSGKRASSSMFKPIAPPKSDLLVERTTGFPALSAKPSLLAAKKVSRRDKKEAQSYPQFRDRLRTFTNNSRQPGIKDHALFEEKRADAPSEETNAVVQDEGRSTIDETNTFEDLSTRDLWHNSKQPRFLSRRESVCSSCGGALSYSNSFASTRRFSAVSIEVPNENLTKRSLLSRHAASIAENSFATEDSAEQPRKWADSSCERVTRDAVAERMEFDRLEKQRNLLYDLISVLYKKNFVKDEIRPYVRHALELCSKEKEEKQ